MSITTKSVAHIYILYSQSMSFKRQILGVFSPEPRLQFVSNNQSNPNHYFPLCALTLNKNIHEVEDFMLRLHVLFSAPFLSGTHDLFDIFTARKRSLGQGNIFISVCQEFCSYGGWVGCLLPGGGGLVRGVPVLGRDWSQGVVLQAHTQGGN